MHLQFERLEQEFLDITWHWGVAHHTRPQFDWRALYESGIKFDGVKIIVQERACSAVPCITRHANTRRALAPMTSPINIVPRPTGEKNIGSLVLTLGPSFQPPPRCRERSKIGIIVHRYQHIRVLGIKLVGRQRANQRDPPDPGTLSSSMHELKHLGQQEGSHGRSVLAHVHHNRGFSNDAQRRQ